MMSTSPYQVSVQPKGEILDLEFAVDTDHRKRRRNRTTQSCLNCHTSKRKCDRKRPCQRCIQLGLTGLCVYEIDDPTLRDDPTLDENTRLRNRIAELESLVRELRGKPHPRWAESNFRDGDPNEKWHSRAAKCGPHTRRRGNSQGANDALLNHPNRGAITSLLSPIKTEAPLEISHSLYRFSPSPPPSMSRYQSFQGSCRHLQSSFESGHRHSYSDPPPSANSSLSYYSATSTPAMIYNPAINGSHSYSDRGGYPVNAPEGDGIYTEQCSPTQGFCPCRTNPSNGPALMALSQQLQGSIGSLRRNNQHTSDTQCLIFRRIAELCNLLYGINAGSADDQSYDELSTPTESDILTPLSASSSHTSFHSSPVGPHPREWHNLSTSTGFNPYFPLQSNDHGIYNDIITSGGIS